MPSRGDPTLRNGLLGYWPVARSPVGHVRDYSPEGNHGVFGFDAKWVWYTNPRAVRHVGRSDKTYFTYLGGPTGADMQVGSYDHDTEELVRTTLQASFSTDDHTNPSVLVRESDGRIFVVWTGHNGDAIYYAVSSHPEDVSEFGSTETLDQGSVTYPNPVQLPGEPDAPLYLFYRDRIVTSDETDDKYGYMGDGNVYYRTSTDGGETWSDQTLLVTAPDGHYSMYFVPAVGTDGDTLHVFFTDAERGGDAPKWNIMYFAYRQGGFYRADGSQIADEGDLPMTKTDLEVVYDSTEPDGEYAWVWDAAVDGGEPAVVYATFPSSLSHEYRYARWDGKRWHDHPITHAGGHVEAGPVELHYSAGIAIDKADPSVVYACIARDGYRGLKRLETDTYGRSWSDRELIRRPVATPIRPVAPTNAADEVPVLWLSGSYPDKDSSRTVLRGLPTDSIGRDTLAGDGEHAVELGLDLYSSAAFRDGVSVSALVRTDDIAAEQTILDFAEAIRLDISRAEPGAFEFTLSDGDSETAVRWSDCESDERYFVEGKWNAADGTMALLVDGASVASRSFDGPIRLNEPHGGWTLMKEGHLRGKGLYGELAEIRLYNRATTDDESAQLARVGR